jgi:hypothetical protein
MHPESPKHQKFTCRSSAKGGSEEVKLRSFTTKIHQARETEMEQMGLSDSMGDTIKWQ